jgi:DNA-binding PucR family transcriptional regulator
MHTNGARSLEEVRAGISERLWARRSEIEQAIYARIHDAVPDTVGGGDPEYQAGLRSAVTAVVAYGLESIERGPEWSRSIPSEAADQARRAARAGVGLGAVLRRYVAGHSELGEFVLREAQHGGLSSNGPALSHIRRMQEGLLEHLTAAIEREYVQEHERVARSPEQRCAEIVRRLLSGEHVNPAELAELNYDIHTSWHVGLVATGAGAQEILRTLRAHFAGRLLPVSLDGRVWAWLGGQQRPVDADIERLSANGHVGVSLAIGEPGMGIEGWRLTHDQAQAALGVALRKPGRVARYADDRLLAAALQNDTLAESLKQRYLTPLGSQRDGGATLRRTLGTYIDVECNATSASYALKVGRRAVKDRVHTAERLIGCPLHECLAELDVALRLEELGHTVVADNSPSAR